MCACTCPCSNFWPCSCLGCFGSIVRVRVHVNFCRLVRAVYMLSSVSVFKSSAMLCHRPGFCLWQYNMWPCLCTYYSSFSWTLHSYFVRPYLCPWPSTCPWPGVVSDSCVFHVASLSCRCRCLVSARGQVSVLGRTRSGVTTPGQLWAMPRLFFGLPRLPCPQIDKTFYVTLMPCCKVSVALVADCPAFALLLWLRHCVPVF